MARRPTEAAGGAPTVSVVLLTYNHERYVAEAIRSVLDQRTPFGVELLITEDRSTDGTGAIVEAAAAAEPERIRLFRSPVNLNTNRVTSRAVEAARGDYVAFLDGDDWWTSPDKLARQVALLEADPGCALAFHDCVVVDGDGRTLAPSFRAGAPSPDRCGFEEIARGNFVPGPSPMIRRSAIHPLPDWFDGAAFGDWPLYLLAAQSGSIRAVECTLAAYRKHAGGLWTSMQEDRRRDAQIAFLGMMMRRSPAWTRPALARTWRWLGMEGLRAAADADPRSVPARAARFLASAPPREAAGAAVEIGRWAAGRLRRRLAGRGRPAAGD